MLLAVGGIAPDPIAADPGLRLVGRMLADLAARWPVTVVASEIRPEVGVTLTGAGVTVERAVDVAGRAATLAGTATVVLVFDVGGPTATSVLAARAAAGPLGDLPLVAVVGTSLASATTEADAHRPGIGFPDGYDRLVAARVAAERAVLVAADAVVCLDDQYAAQVADVLGDDPTGRPPVHVLTRPRPAGAAPWRHGERSGLAVPGRWHSEIGLPDAVGLHALAGAAGTAASTHDTLAPIRLVGLDGVAAPLAAARALVRRPTAGLPGPVPGAGRPGTWDDGRTWGEALTWARVVVLPRRHGLPDPLVVDDVVAATVPLLALARAVTSDRLGPAHHLVACVDTDDLVERAVALVVDRHRWEAHRDALRASVETWPDAPTLADQVAAVVAEVGGGPSTNDHRPMVAAPHDTTAPLTCRPVPRPPGTLAAAAPAAAVHEAAMGLGWRLDRTEALRAQSVADPARRERWWRAVHEESPAQLDRIRQDPLLLHWQPTVSILVPCWRTPHPLLEAMVASVQAQVYPHWQLCLVDDASGDPDLAARLHELAAGDDRIVARVLDTNVGIAGATDAALGLATGELVALLDHDDELHPAALLRVLERWELEPDLDAVHTDEDKLLADGTRAESHRKPDANPDLLLGISYPNHLTVVRRTLLDELGGWRSGFDGSQDFDLWLRLTERTERIGHVARPLYHWRKVAGSTAADAGEKSAAGPNGARALAEAIIRRGVRADVGPGVLPTWHHVRWRHDEAPLVSIVIPTRDGGDMVQRVLDGITATTRHPWELVLVDNCTTDPASLACFEALGAAGATVVRYPHDFHFARQIDLGVAAARGPLCLILNNDTVIDQDGWLEEMVGQAQRPEVGAVGLRLLRPSGEPQHEGIVLGVGGVAWNLDSGPHGEWGQVVRDCSAVTAAAVLCRTEVLRAVGGFDDGLRVAFNDVDLCLRISALGWRVVYTPFAELAHHESASRGSLHPAEDEDRYVDRWGPPRSLRDPFYNVSLDLLGAEMLVL